jgi:predicted metal-dependent hydrolase
VKQKDELKYDSVACSGVTIAYNWCRSRRKTLGITIRPDRSVAVRVPLRTPISEVRRFVLGRAEWVVKVWKKQGGQSIKPLQEYSRGAVFMYLGAAYRLEFTTGPESPLILHDGLLIMPVSELPTEETVRTRIDSWYRSQAAKLVKERSEVCHRMMHDQGFTLPPVTIRSMKTRWGSYSYRTRRITLNLNLIKAPLACLDYVIIHELCHIKLRHHGSEFWKLVGRYVPDYSTIRAQLRGFV